MKQGLFLISQTILLSIVMVRKLYTVRDKVHEAYKIE